MEQMTGSARTGTCHLLQLRHVGARRPPWTADTADVPAGAPDRRRPRAQRSDGRAEYPRPMAAETSQTLDRGLRVLRTLAAAPHGLSITALAAEIGVNRTVVYRLGATPEQHGLARPDPAGRRHRRPRRPAPAP